MNMRKRSVRLTEEALQKIEREAKDQGYSSASAFIRAALARDTRGDRTDLNEVEQRIAASLGRVSREIRAVANAQQALFAFVDALTKTVLTCVPEPVGEAYPQAVARARARYDRFLKSVGSGMSGDSQAALNSLVERVN